VSRRPLHLDLTMSCIVDDDAAYHEEVGCRQRFKKVRGVFGRVVGTFARVIWFSFSARSVSPSVQHIEQCMSETHEEHGKDHEEPYDLLGDVDDDVDGSPERLDDSQLKYLPE